jgi:hypothetical protein
VSFFTHHMWHLAAPHLRPGSHLECLQVRISLAVYWYEASLAVFFSVLYQAVCSGRGAEVVVFTAMCVRVQSQYTASIAFRNLRRTLSAHYTSYIYGSLNDGDTF